MPFAYFSPFSVYQQSFHPPSLLWHRQQYWNDDDERKERLSCSYVNLKTKGANVINSNAVVVDQPLEDTYLGISSLRCRLLDRSITTSGPTICQRHFQSFFPILECNLYCGFIGLRSQYLTKRSVRAMLIRFFVNQNTFFYTSRMAFETRV